MDGCWGPSIIHLDLKKMLLAQSARILSSILIGLFFA